MKKMWFVISNLIYVLVGIIASVLIGANSVLMSLPYTANITIVFSMVYVLLLCVVQFFVSRKLIKKNVLSIVSIIVRSVPEVLIWLVHIIFFLQWPDNAFLIAEYLIYILLVAAEKAMILICYRRHRLTSVSTICQSTSNPNA